LGVRIANERTPHDGELLARADLAAAAALRELPEALVLVFDGDMRFVASAGQALERRTGAGACRDGDPVSGAFAAEVWREMEPLFATALAGETRSREIWTADDRHCLMVDVGPLRAGGDDGEAAASGAGVAVVLDITARRHADVFSAQPAAGFEAVFDSAPIGSGLLDRDGRWLLVNRALCEITGYTAEELIGKRFDGIMHPAEAANDAEQRARLLTGEIPAYQVEKRYFDAAGETSSALVSVSLVRDRRGHPLHFIAQFQDISERKELEEHLRLLADHDPLTGLRNRGLFAHDLKLQVARSHRYGEVAGLMLIDLDSIHALAEEHGRDAAEEARRAVARALTRRLRETDLIGRLGADRFAVLLPHIDDEGISVVAEGLMRVIPACSVDVGRDVVHPSVRLGHALIDARTPTAEVALAEAERAMRVGVRAGL
jgi:PAS domain S-box-containing protein/diguanylate cyclase (GGDEF)-like protein